MSYYEILVNTGSGNDFLPDDTWTNADSSSAIPIICRDWVGTGSRNSSKQM